MKRSLSGWMLCCILSFATLAFAQTATTSLRGVVKDSSGALVPGASITLTDQATDNAYHAVSNASGFYIFPIISPAHYLISVTSSGFATRSVTAELLVDQPATIDFTLSVKAEPVTVDVSTSAETLDLADATMGNAVGNTTIETLPMDGRNPISLLSLQPGVLYMGSEVVDSRQGAVAGGRSDQGNITLDGLDDNDQIFGTAFTGVLRSTLDSTEEFRVTTSNGTAASGRSSGAQINLITKSGTNKMHGALYEYYRPDNVVANQYFLKYNDLTSNQPNTPQFYLVNTFGGSIGGPIFKDKLFYFFNYEGQRIGTHDVVGATVPTPSFMAGGLQYPDATTGATDALTPAQVKTLDMPCTNFVFPAPPATGGTPVCPNGPGANAAMLKYLSTEPTTTSAIGGDGGLNSGEIFFTSPAPATLSTSIVKLDYNMNSKNHFFVRGNLQKDTVAGDENFPGQPPQSFYDDNTKGLSAGHTWIPTASIVNDVRYGYVRQGWQSGGIAPGEWVYISGLTQPTAQTGTTSLHVPVNNIVDTLTWNKGSHTFAFGGNWRAITNHHSSNNGSFNNAETNYAYASTGDLPIPANMAQGFTNQWSQDWANLMGVIPELTNVYNYSITGPTTGTALAAGAPITKNFHANEFEGYMQDAWHARRNITVTYGVRYTRLQTPYETNGQQITPTIDTDKWYQTREFAAQQAAREAAQERARQAAELAAQRAAQQAQAAPQGTQQSAWQQPPERQPALPPHLQPSPPPAPAPSQEGASSPQRAPWLSTDASENAGRPAWLMPERPESVGPPALPPAPVDTLQSSRDHLVSRWVALRSVFEDNVPAQSAPAPTTARAPVLAVFSLAGGVGKTSLVATLGRVLSARGERVLLVDTAAYGLLPFFFGARDQRPGLLRTFSPPVASSAAPIQMVTIDPESLGPEPAGAEAGGLNGLNGLAGEISRYARGGVSRVIVDLATASGAVTRKLIRMAPMILVPVMPDMNSVVSVTSIDDFFEHNSAAGTKVPLFYVMNQFDPSLPLHLDIREVLREQLGDRLLPFALRRTPAVSEALAEGMTVMDYAPNSTVAEDFATLAGWVKSLSAPASTTYRGVRWSER